MMKSEEHPVKRLNRDEFASALRKGQGRALLHVLRYGLDGVADLVLDACLHNQVYDHMIEDPRDGWLFSMFKDSAYFPEFRAAMLEALASQPVGMDFDQLLLLVRNFALMGDKEARQAFGEGVYLNAARNNSNFDGLGVIDWIKLEGVEGLLQLARIYGQRLIADPLDCVCDDILHQEEYPRFRSVLEAASQQDAAVAAYVAYLDKRQKDLASIETVSVETRKEQRRQKVRQEYTVQSIIEAAQTGKGPSSVYPPFGKYATQSELEQIYAYLLTEKKAKVRTRLLWVFRKAKLPHLDDRLFVWANGKNEQLRQAAIDALAQVSDAKVHALARRKVESGSLLGTDNDTLRLFLNNFAPEDGPLIAKALAKLDPDPDDAHSLGSSIHAIAAQNESPALVEVMLWVYENTPCGFCRYGVVKWLVGHNLLSESLRLECQYDAEVDTREFVQGM